jgi:hypothetical protein
MARLTDFHRQHLAETKEPCKGGEVHFVVYPLSHLMNSLLDVLMKEGGMELS